MKVIVYKQSAMGGEPITLCFLALFVLIVTEVYWICLKKNIYISTIFEVD